MLSKIITYSYFKLLLIVLGVLITMNINAQISIRTLPAFSAGGYVPERTNFELTNIGLPQQIIIQIEVTDVENNVVVKIKSNTLTLNNGVEQFLPNAISQFSMVEISEQKIDAKLTLVNGNYICTYTILSPEEEIVLSTFKSTIFVNQKLQAPKKQSVFTTSGQGQLSVFYSTRQQSFSNLPNLYYQANLTPTFSLFDFPVTAQLNLSSLKTNNLQNTNTFSVNFNINEFKNKLHKKLVTTLKEQDSLLNYKKYLDVLDKDSLHKYKKIVANGKNIDELSNILLPDSLTKIKSKLLNLKDSLVHLKNKYDTLTNTNQYVDALTDTTATIIDSVRTKINTTLKEKNTIDSLTKKIKFYEDIVKAQELLKKKKEEYEGYYRKYKDLEQKINKNKLLDSLNTNVTNYKEEIEKINKSYTNLDSLKSNLKDNKLFRKIDKVLLSFKQFNIGVSYPKISEYTVNGTRVNGINIEALTNGVFTSYTQGVILDAVNVFNPTTASYRRTLYSSTIGVGTPESNHLLFTFLTSSDNANSINPRDSIFQTLVLPKSNYVLATNFKKSLLNNVVSFSGELAASQTTRDITLSNAFSSFNTTGSNNWFRNIILQKDISTNTYTGLALKGQVDLKLFKGKTTYTNSIKRVGGDFESFGTPFLLRDVIILESRIKNKLFKNIIQINVGVRNINDNLSGFKLNTTGNLQFMGDMKFTLKKFPTISLSYIPVRQQSDTSIINLNTINLNSVYQYRMKYWSSSVNFNYIQQRSQSNYSKSLNFYSENLVLSKSITLKSGLSFLVSYNYINFISEEFPSLKTNNIALNSSFGLFKKRLINTVSLTYINNSLERKIGYMYNAAWPINKKISINIQIERNQFNSIMVNPQLAVPSFVEFLSQLTIIAKW